MQNRGIKVNKQLDVHGENFYPENMTVEQHCISKNFNVNLSHLLIKLQ